MCTLSVTPGVPIYKDNIFPFNKNIFRFTVTKMLQSFKKMTIEGLSGDRKTYTRQCAHAEGWGLSCISTAAVQ